MMATSTATRSDVDIQREVLEELQFDPRVQPNEVGVTVKNGVVTLTGRVDSFLKKWAAEDAAMRVRGVVAVANEIEVRLPFESERTDEDIAAAAVRALEWDADLPTDRIKVTVSKGQVTLDGEVDWEYQKRDAERVVSRLRGVKGVVNLIKVKPRTSPDDVKRKIEEALIRSAATDAERIEVEVHGDRIILKGTVRSWAEREEAERAAWSVPGVADVKNHILVSD